MRLDVDGMQVMSTLLENMPATPSTTIASTSTESLPGPDPADVPEGEGVTPSHPTPLVQDKHAPPFDILYLHPTDGGLWGSQISLLSSSLSCDFGRDQVRTSHALAGHRE